MNNLKKNKGCNNKCLQHHSYRLHKISTLSINNSAEKNFKSKPLTKNRLVLGWKFYP